MRLGRRRTPTPLRTPRTVSSRPVTFFILRRALLHSGMSLAELPLTVPLLATITQQTQTQFSGGFFWEVFKQPKPGMNEATPTQVAQAVCNVVLPGSPRCAGTLPVWQN